MKREEQEYKPKAPINGTLNEVQSTATDVPEPLMFSFGWSETDVDQDYNSTNTVNITNTNTAGEALGEFFRSGGANTIVLGIAFIGISILVAFGVAARLRSSGGKGKNKSKANKVQQRVVVQK